MRFQHAQGRRQKKIEQPDEVRIGAMPRPPEIPTVPKIDPGHKEECLHIEPLPDDNNASTIEPAPGKTDDGLLEAETEHGGVGLLYAEICNTFESGSASWRKLAAKPDGPAVAVVEDALRKCDRYAKTLEDKLLDDHDPETREEFALCID